MDKIKLKRNQKVYQDGQQCNKVYIVWKGEFEIEQKLQKRNDTKNIKTQRVMGLEQPQKNILAKKLPELEDLPVSHKLKIMGQGCLLGEDDLLSTKNNMIH